MIPKDHYENAFDIPEPKLCAVVEHAKAIAERLEAHDFDGVNLLNDSGEAAHQTVPHFHLHLAPRRRGDELHLWPDSSYEESNFDQTYEHVRDVLDHEPSR